MKLHIGCGPVYLDGYCNCDVRCKGHFLAFDRPDLVDKNKTTIDKYYTKNVDRNAIEKRLFNHEEVVVDIFAKAHRLPFPDGSIEEIRTYQMFEHFSLPEAIKLLKYWHRKLVNRGKLYLDIPDLAQTAYLFVNAQSEEDKDWYTRLLYGSHKDAYGVHKMMYTRNSISRLLYQYGYNDLKFHDNIHFYPAFAVEATKYD